MRGPLCERTLWEDPTNLGGPYGRTPQIWEDPMGGPYGRTIGYWRTPRIWEDPMGGPYGRSIGYWRTPWEDPVALEDPTDLGGPRGRTLWHWRTPQIWEDPMGASCGAGGPRDIRKTTGGPRVRTPW